MIPRKKQKKSETVINTYVSLMKKHWKKMAEIPEEHIFSLGAFKIMSEKRNSLFYLANKLYDRNIFLFHFSQVLLKIVLFY